MRRPLNIALSLLTVSVSLSAVTSLNILGIFPHQGKSHFFVFEPYLRELARRGHDVTVISHFPQKTPVENYIDISLAGSAKILEESFPLERSYITIVMIAQFLASSGNDNCRQMLKNKEVQNLWKTKAKFDVVVVEQFNSDCALGLAYKLGAPVVGVTSHTLIPCHFDRFGTPYNPSYVSSMFFDGGTKPTLYQRFETMVFYVYFNAFYKWHVQRVDQNTLAEYFDDVPPLEELGRDIKIMLLYKHSILFGSSLSPDNIKEVGGYHVAMPKQLSGDLKKFIEESEHGVIYVSFGSMLKASSTPRDKLEVIIAALSELPQRVVWKWEEPNLPGNPKNIYVSNWLPQNDILAHPNVLAFYSHCGLLGVTEAIHHGVPMVGMPIFGDQPSNAAAVGESGLGVIIQFNELTKESLLKKFKTVLDPEFKGKVKLISKAWHDRPLSAMDSAIYWTEFAARNGNLTFRSPAADVPLYQYLLLDVLGIFSFLFLAIIYLVKYLFCGKTTPSNVKQLITKSKRA